MNSTTRLAVCLAMFLTGCATTGLDEPAGPGRPAPDTPAGYLAANPGFPSMLDDASMFMAAASTAASNGDIPALLNACANLDNWATEASSRYGDYPDRDWLPTVGDVSRTAEACLDMDWAATVRYITEAGAGFDRLAARFE